MIVLITTRGHGYTLKSIVDGTFGAPTPKFRIVSYERMFRSVRVPRATYLFADLERLSPWELSVASDLYRSMTEAGLRCLNDPARAMSRVELLTSLHQSGVNPFSVLRADARPRPSRFPVFIRPEGDHTTPAGDLYHSQEELDRALAALRASSIPLRGLLVIEYAPAVYRDGLWAKWGTWRIGDQVIVEHIAVDDVWLVKIGDPAKITDAIAADEQDAVRSNRFAAELRAAFDVGAIEFGRADHGTINGRQVVYEINTNPYMGWYSRKGSPMRQETQRLARSRIADALDAIDTPLGSLTAVPATSSRKPTRWWHLGFKTPKRP